MERDSVFPILSIFLLAGTLMAAPPAIAVKACPRRQPTPASYTWNFKAEAANLFSQVQREAADVADRADQLNLLASDNETSWQAQATGLSRIKGDVNRIAGQMCRLESIRRVTAPWEQKAIDRLAVRERELADTTGAMITFLNQHHQELWLPAYRNYATALYQNANATAHSLQESVQYAKAHQQELQMETSPGMKVGS